MQLGVGATVAVLAAGGCSPDSTTSPGTSTGHRHGPKKEKKRKKGKNGKYGIKRQNKIDTKHICLHVSTRECAQQAL